MTKFEKHIGEALPPKATAFLAFSTLGEIERKARELKFNSWCPVAMENDSKELRDAMKQTSEMLFKFIDFKKQTHTQ